MKIVDSRRQMSEFFSSIEDRFPVEEVEIDGVAIWPIVRHYVFDIMSGNLTAESNFRTVVRRVASTITMATSHTHARRIHKALANSRVIFLDMPAHGTKMDGRIAHQFFEPISQMIGDRINVGWLSLPNDRLRQPQRPRSCELKGVAGANAYSIGRTRSPDSLQELLQLIASEIPVNASFVRTEQVLRRVRHVFSISTFLETSLPRECTALFQCCYYHSLGFAASLACSRRGIRCIEFQHGQQGEFHPLYTNWHRRFRSGSLSTYQLIPDTFWAWSETDAERMRAGLPAETTVVAGGNPFLLHRLEDLGHRDLEVYGDQRPEILFTMQDFALPEFVWSAIETLQSKYKFRFRIHPARPGLREIIENECRSRLGHPDGWEIDETTRMDLYRLFRRVTVHVTGWSTCAYEALYFGVPTILIHPNGRDAMRNPIKDGVFVYTDSAKTLIHHLERPPTTSMHRDIYISVDKSLMMEALELVVGGIQTGHAIETDCS